jgi:hypothetical protein
MSSKREQKIARSIEMMFAGTDDEMLKDIILACALGKSEDEKDAIVEKWSGKRKEQEEYAAQFKTEFNESNPTGLQDFNPAGECIEIEPVKSADNITFELHEESREFLTPCTGHEGLELKHPNDLLYSA